MKSKIDLRPIDSSLIEDEVTGEWTCFCGNEEMGEGFYGCNEHGHAIEDPDPKYWRCSVCGSIFKI